MSVQENVGGVIVYLVLTKTGRIYYYNYHPGEEDMPMTYLPLTLHIETVVKSPFGMSHLLLTTDKEILYYSCGRVGPFEINNSPLNSIHFFGRIPVAITLRGEILPLFFYTKPENKIDEPVIDVSYVDDYKVYLTCSGRVYVCNGSSQVKELIPPDNAVVVGLGCNSISGLHLKLSTSNEGSYLCPKKVLEELWF